MGWLILLTLLIEVGVLLYLEVKAWHTLYTPLNFLMLPYVAILLLTVLVSGKWGIVDFYYPSIVYWIVGLFLFAIPSYSMGLVLQKKDKPIIRPINDGDELSNVVIALAVIMCLAFLYRLKQTLGSSSATFGTDEFGMDYDGHGLWAHLSKFNLPLLILCIYYADRRKWWLWIIIITLIFITFVHQVKGWVIIPCVTGLAMRLYSGKTHLTARFLFFLALGAVAVFLVSYILSLVVGGNAMLGGAILEFILRHFVHYLTSGVLGFSMDLAAGMPDKGNIEVLFAQFVNLINVMTGSDEIISQVNGVFFHTGLNNTNVRTFFGTIAVYTNPAQFVFVTLLWSSVLYSLKLLTIRFRSVYSNTIYFFECAMLSMGWFEYYFFHLDVIEVPVMTLIVMTVVALTDNKTA